MTLLPGAPFGLLLALVSVGCAATVQGVSTDAGSDVGPADGSDGGAIDVRPDAREGPRVVQVTAAGAHTCALDDRGRVWCFGQGRYGQLGDGRREDRATPVEVVLGEPVVALSAGASAVHTCAVTRSGAVWCWGRDAEGELGAPPIAPRCGDPRALVDCRERPLRLNLPEPAVQAAVGSYHTCVRTAGGAVYCVGDNRWGQLGDGTLRSRETPRRVEGVEGAQEVVAGGTHTCARTAAGVLCWGENAAGELGQEPDAGESCTERMGRPVPCRARPQRVNVQAVGITAGALHTCAWTAAGEALCWGDSTFRQVGDGTDAWLRTTPTRVAGITDVAEVSAGAWHTCARTRRGALFCWGDGGLGQLGEEPAPFYRRTPVPVAGVEAMAGLSLGGWHSCGWTLAGRCLCWGSNDQRQLGDPGEGRSMPRVVEFP